MNGTENEGGGTSPSKPMPSMEARREAEGTDEVDTHGVRVCEEVGPGAVSVKEIGVTIGRAFSLVQRVDGRGEELQPSMDAGVVLAYLGDVLERLVVRVYVELDGSRVTA